MYHWGAAIQSYFSEASSFTPQGQQTAIGRPVGAITFTTTQRQRILIDLKGTRVLDFTKNRGVLT
jgi:hypothetical protein